jgi:hypothetical protein
MKYMRWTLFHGVNDAEYTSAVSTGVSTTDNRSCAGRTNTA